MEKRNFYHKGKHRNKYRVPRKLKKERKKRALKFYKLNKERLEPIYGVFWFDHVIFGG